MPKAKAARPAAPAAKGRLPKKPRADARTRRSVEPEVREISISKFKATCLAEIEEVRRTGKRLRVTRFGVAVAEVTPAQENPKKRWIGSLAHLGEVTGDLVAPIGAFDNWEPEDL